MASRTKSKRMLITGSGSGIGRDAVRALADRGHSVYATTHTEAQAAWWASVGGPGVKAFKLDITEETDRARVADLPIDVLVNNAALGESGSLAEVPLERVRAAFETNLFATLALTQLVLRGMIARRSGTILFISSLAGRLPAPFLMPYAMTKFALSAAADALRQEMAQLDRGVHIAVVEPGAYHTGFNQKMVAKKYEWMRHGSYFQDQLAALKAQEERLFAILELRSTRTIVRKIVQAVEAEKPRLRYVEPWWQGVGVRFLRAVGK
jgi:short-subunit dehydrogenase